MDYKYIIYALLAVAVILAIIIIGDKLDISFFGLKMKAGRIFRKNSAKIDGDRNKVRQGGNTKSSPSNNNAAIKGSDNDVEQG